MSEPVYVKRKSRTYMQWPTGHVYFAAIAGRDDVVKVGWSQNPWWRTREFGADVTVVDTVEIDRASALWGTGSGSLEFRLHRRLARHRVDPRTMEFTDRGEWYAMTPAEAKAAAMVELASLGQATATGAKSGPIESSASNEERGQQ